VQQTALYEQHKRLNAKIVDFAGWAMPIQYPTGILVEARAVRQGTGLFDVSHMGRLQFTGTGVEILLDKVFTRNVLSLRDGMARYGLLCNENGGIVDDVIISRVEEHKYSVVCNAGNRSTVVEWIEKWATDAGNVEMEDTTGWTGMIAVQGPNSGNTILRSLDIDVGDLRRFRVQEYSYADKLITVSRTGYTGEDGFEVVCNAMDASQIWCDLVEGGAVPCGLGSRDNLRLEAALPLHGADIDGSTNPIEAGLARFVDFDKEQFVGKKALDSINERGLDRKFVGIEISARGILRAGCILYQSDTEIGIITSGGYGANIGKSIGLAFVATGFAELGQELLVDIRGQRVEAQVVSLPFYVNQ
jgi:aminomethyltransferase